MTDFEIEIHLNLRTLNPSVLPKMRSRIRSSYLWSLSGEGSAHVRQRYAHLMHNVPNILSRDRIQL